MTQYRSIGVGGEESGDASDIAATWLRLGGRGVDNALIYRDQRKVAAAIKESKIPRKELFLTSKIPGYLGPRLTKKFVQEDLDELQTSYLDLLLIHFDHLCERSRAEI